MKEIEQAKKVLPIVSIQNRYNIEDRDSEEALNYCEKEKMAFMPWAPIGGSGKGSLTKAGGVPSKRKQNVTTPVSCSWRWRGCCTDRR